jgi:hypothetical protein
VSTVQKTLDELCVDTIRTLAIDAVQKAESGHPGLPLGAAPRGRPGWPEFAFWTASIASVRIVSTQSSSRDSRTVLNSSSADPPLFVSKRALGSYYAPARRRDPRKGRLRPLSARISP